MIHPLRVAAVGNDDRFGTFIKNALSTQTESPYRAWILHWDKTMDSIDVYGPNIIVLDCTVSKRVVFSVLQKIKMISNRPRVLALTEYDDDEFIQRAAVLGVDYFLMKPVDGPVLGKRIMQIANPKGARMHLTEERRRRSAEKYAAAHLVRIGMPAHFKGFEYSIEAVVMVSIDSTLINAITTKLYPAIAAQYDSTAIQVERSIRHAVETTWTRGNLEAIDRLFAYTVDAHRGKPTNASFIARLSDQVRMDTLMARQGTSHVFSSM